MRSHTYDFTLRDLVRLLGLPLLPVAAFAIFMHASAVLGLLPRPRATLDLDRTILIHKAEASRARHDARLLLLGDSSCMIDVSAPQLARELRQPVLNLGTLSYLDLMANAALLREFNTANPNQLKAVILLMHPEALRRPTPEEYHTDFLESALSGREAVGQERTRSLVARVLGLEIFRTRILSRAVPAPLPGAYGRRFGFSSDLQRHLTENNGSLIDPDPRKFEGNAEYRLAPQLEAASRAFREAVPKGVKLLVGITPVPESFAAPGYPEIHRQMLRQWSEWLRADVALDEPGATFPDHMFVKTTHLNEQGARIYTAQLARSLRSIAP